jgi:hypothetical protein
MAPIALMIAQIATTSNNGNGSAARAVASDTIDAPDFKLDY